jgi:hypothetical protein
MPRSGCAKLYHFLHDQTGYRILIITVRDGRQPRTDFSGPYNIEFFGIVSYSWETDVWE